MEPSTDTISQYFRGIQKLAQIDREELHKLWKKAKRGDRAAKQRIMEANLRLVVPIAKKYHRQGIDFMDLIEEGNLGLMHSIDKFEPKKGYRFSTYASYWIEQSIRRAVEEQSKTIRIPPHAWEALRKWLKQWEKLHSQLGRDPTLAEMARKMHWTARQVRGVLDAAEAARGMGSLEAPIDSEDENITVEDMISESDKQSPESLISVLKLHDELNQALREIGERERMILEFRHGLTGQTPMTLEEVGKRLKLSRERIRQIEERALLRLRRVANRMGLIEVSETRPNAPNLQPGWNTPKLRTDILGQEIPEGRRTAPTPAHILAARQPRRMLFNKAGGGGKKGEALMKAKQGLDLKSFVKDVPDFPKKGIVFKDITPLLADAEAFASTIDRMAEPFVGQGITVVAGIESRGFLLATPIAYRLGAGVVPIRKKGKLPRRVHSASYDLEYGTDSIEAHADAFPKGAKVLLVDDVLATGGTARAACQLVEKIGGELSGVSFLIELDFLKGRAKLPGRNIRSLLSY